MRKIGRWPPRMWIDFGNLLNQLRHHLADTPPTLVARSTPAAQATAQTGPKSAARPVANGKREAMPAGEPMEVWIISAP